MDNGTFEYRFDLDRDYFIDIILKYQSILPFITLVTIRPLFFVIIMKKRSHMTSDIRVAYIINQVMMMAQEFNFCYLFRIHDLAPYSGLYCDGPICRMGIDKPILMLILATTTIGTVPTFLLLLLRMHQRIIGTTNSMMKLGVKTQAGIVFFLTVILVANVAGFYAFGRDCDDAQEIEKIPDLAWLKARGGTLFIFGPPGHSQFFRKELWMLLCSILIIAPFVAAATFHSMKIIREQTLQQALTTHTQRLQTRLARVFFLQLIGVNCFFILPLSMMLLHMAIDVSGMLPHWMYSVLRCLLIIPFTLESTQLSLIFLLKNPVHRQIVKAAFLHLPTLKNSETRISVQERKDTRHWTKSNVPQNQQFSNL